MEARTDVSMNTQAGDFGRFAETYAQRVNHVVKKVFTTDYKGEPVEWAVFEAGTVVMVPAADASTFDDLAAVAVRVLKKNGPVYPGGPAGDFDSVRLEKFFGEGCAEWFVFFDVDGSFPQGTALFGVYIGSPQSGSPPDLFIGLHQLDAREKDAQASQVASSSFDLAPVAWSPETHVNFPLKSRRLVRLLLLVQKRSAQTGGQFFSHEVMIKFVLPMLVQFHEQ